MSQKSDIPPKIPKEFEKLERAITLLGNRTKAELNIKARRELETLVGKYPSLDQAVAWKSYLRSYRKKIKEASK